MRILQLRFKNLNSLCGEWDINLTDPAFIGDGIFAITGPTGAGKTTILDAICLALYGQTPRLNKVTKSENEIMSRLTGECFAEVVFETLAGRYRCHWSQHRSRKKPDGELQHPKHEIVDANSGVVLESKLKDVEEKMEKVTGMDFDRFTRSMLLAQGGFAAFLQAPPNERAPILEKITGTEIYSNISIRIHERYGLEREKLEKQKAEIAGLTLLNEKEEQELSCSLEQKSSAEKTSALQIEEIKRAVIWMEGIKRFQLELIQCSLQKENLEKERAAFLPFNEQLKRANDALEIKGDYDLLSRIRKEQEADSEEQKELQTLIVPLEHGVKAALEKAEKYKKTLVRVTQELQTQIPFIRQAQELDLKIKESSKSLDVQGSRISTIETALSHLRLKKKEGVASHEDLLKSLTELRNELNKTKLDEGLVENLKTIESEIHTLKTCCAQLDQKLVERELVNECLEKTRKKHAEMSEHLKVLTSDLEEKEKEAASRENDLRKLLKQRELSEWHSELNASTVKGHLIENALNAVNSLTEVKNINSIFQEQYKTLSLEEQHVVERLKIRKEEHVALESKVQHLQEKFMLLTRISDLEEARHQLENGQPCPLCGAINHPFVEASIPTPNETGVQLEVARSELKLNEKEIYALKERQGQIKTSVEGNVARRKECCGQIEKYEKMAAAYCSNLLIEVDMERLKALKSQITDKKVEAETIIHLANAKEKELKEIQSLANKAEAQVADTKRNLEKVFYKKEEAGANQERFQKEEEALQKICEQYFIRIQSTLLGYGYEHMSIDKTDSILTQLKSRRDKWISNQSKRNELERDLATHEVEFRKNSEAILEKEKDLDEERRVFVDLQNESKNHLLEREKIFGKRNPWEEERRLSLNVENAQKELLQTQQNFSEATNQLNDKKSKCVQLREKIVKRSLELQSLENIFLSLLEKKGFIHENDFISSYLNDLDRKQLTVESLRLIREVASVASREGDVKAKLEEELAKNLTQKSLVELSHALSCLADEQKRLNQEIGAIKLRMRNNEHQKVQHERHVQAIELQKKECNRWEQLHALIGSSDGKKFRNFAQSLTLEMMIGHANQKLQKLTDRYLLVPDAAIPLEIKVVDNYQAGEVRTTKNLSGGESFIISLSLALGLSQMASKNVKIDSLFLDEGFGTLDEDALEIALETLSSLQRDGKLIGVISHVSALKERINTQIKVVPKPGGKSYITGPGCKSCVGKPLGP